MKKILLLTTGGTIACRQGSRGLTPAPVNTSLFRAGDGYAFETRSLFDLDSSNIQPEEWLVMARTVFELRADYDGFIILHGTDTLAYTAAALSFMLPGLDRAVVLTGSQTPMDDPATDALTNFHTAEAAISGGMRGVLVAFGRQIIRGTRAVKTDALDFAAFQSVNAPCMAKLQANGLRIAERACPGAYAALPPGLADYIDSGVLLLKLVPGSAPALLDALPTLGYRGLVIEAFGLGGAHYLRRDLLQPIKRLTEAGLPVVVRSQCLAGGSDLSVYEVGQRLSAVGVICARDMTAEAAVTKLMWLTAQNKSPEETRTLFLTNMVGEIDTP